MENRFLTIATQIMVISIVLAVILLFIGISILVLLHICIVGRMLWSGPTSAGERCGDELVGLSPEDLEKLPFYDFPAGGEEGPTDCAVCLESFRKGERCRLLPMCRHSFHADCVDSWLTRTPLCPMCRTRACQQKGEEEEEEGVESGSVVIGFSVSS